MNCEKCGSNNIKRLGLRFAGKEKFLKFSCNDCSYEFTTDYVPVTKMKAQNLVVTSAVDGFAINNVFLDSLKLYCKHNKAKLIILPVNHGKPYSDTAYPLEIRDLIVDTNLSIEDKTLILGSIKLGATLESPLHGLNSLSKGKNVVFGHPQVQLRTLPRKSEKYPAIITTTGTISLSHYGENKTSQKANFNHSFSALFIDGKNQSRMRHLNFDGIGFYDINGYYTDTSVSPVKNILALVTGDEHVCFYDQSILESVYGKTGIVATLKPKYIIRHDVLDCYAISHHHRNNVLTRYTKFRTNRDDIEKELNQTIDFINKTTPADSISLIISSNHNSHLLRWLNEADPKLDLVNSKIYHKLMYQLLEEIDGNVSKDNSTHFTDPFKLYAQERLKENIKFLSPSESFELNGVDLNNHGDLGVNGSRGSSLQYKDLPLKSIIGHSHSPNINKGCYQVGTSSILRLEYNKGLSSWDSAHCILYPNGKRQMIFIRDGKWK